MTISWPFFSSTTGGIHSSFLVHHELPSGCGSDSNPKVAWEEEPPNKIAFCTAPINLTRDASHFDQWVRYHRAMSKETAHFFIYDAGALRKSSQLNATFQKYVSRGEMTIDNTEQVAQYKVFFFAQMLFLYDCFHRSVNRFR